MSDSHNLSDLLATPEESLDSINYSPSDRLDRLSKVKEGKVKSYTEAPEGLVFEPAILKSLRDLDSPKFEGVTGGLGRGVDSDGNPYDLTGKETGDRLNDIDSLEVFPESQHQYDYQHNNPDGIEKMLRQRSWLADKRGVDPSEITNEDVYEEAGKGVVKTVAILKAQATGDQDLIEQALAWEPSKELTAQWRTSAPTVGNDLNIEVERAFTGEYGNYGRPISYVRPKGSKSLLGVDAGYEYTPYAPRSNGTYSSSPQRVIQPEYGLTFEEIHNKRMARHADFTDRIANNVAGFGSTFVKELIVKPLDAVGDLTGMYDLGTGEEIDSGVDNFFGYNSYYQEQAMEEIGKQWDIVSDSNASTADRMRAAGRGVIEAFTTPEMLGTSLGALLSWVTPGTILKAVGVGSKYASNIKRIDNLVDAGKFTSNVARAKKAKAFMSIPGAKNALATQSGFIVSAMGNVNQQYEEFVDNNGGVGLEGSDKAKWFAGRFAVQLVNQNLDKIVDFNVIKNPGVISSIIPAAKAMTNKEFSGLAKALAKGVGKTAENMTKEAAQEYAQTTMELFNSRYGSEMFKDADSFIKFLQDERNIDEAGVAALAGAGGAPQFEALGTVVPATKKTLGTLTELAGLTRDKITNRPTNPQGKVDLAEVLSDAKAVEEEISGLNSTATNVASAYYTAQLGTDAVAKQQAKDQIKVAREGLMSGTGTIFHSDKKKDIADKLKDIDPIVESIVADDPTVPIEDLMKGIARGLKASKKEDFVAIRKAVIKSHRAGLEYASIKPMEDVSKEVSEGPKGFRTYFLAAKAAKAEGNEELYNKSIANLDYFYNYHKTKLGRIKAAEQEIAKKISARADRLVKKGTVPDRTHALVLLKKEYANKGKSDEINNSDDRNTLKTEIKYTYVASKLLDPTFDSHIYSIIDSMSAESSLIGKAYNSLMESEGPSESPSLPSTGETVYDVPPVVDSEPSTPKETEEEVSTPSEAGTQEVTEVSDTPVVEESTASEGEFDLGELYVDEDSLKELESKIPKPKKPKPVEEEVDFSGVDGDISELEAKLPDAKEDELDFSDDDLSKLMDKAVSKEPTSTKELSPEDELQAQLDAEGMPEATEDELEAMLSEAEGRTPKKEKEVIEKDDTVDQFGELKARVKDNNARIEERKSQLRIKGIRSKKDQEKDEDLALLLERKEDLETEKDSFSSVLTDFIKSRAEGFGKHKDTKFTIFTKFTTDLPLVDYYKSKRYEVDYDEVNNKYMVRFNESILSLFKDIKATGFTLTDRTKKTARKSTKEFASKLLDNLGLEEGVIQSKFVKDVKLNPSQLLILDSEGKINYNTIEAMESAAYEYFIEDSTNLGGASRSYEDVADIVGIPEESVSPELYLALLQGGVTLKVAASSVGNKVLKNLGIGIKDIQYREALATSFGMSALQGLKDDQIIFSSYKPSEFEKASNGGVFRANEVPLVKGSSKMFDRMEEARNTIEYFEEKLVVKVDKSRNYRKEGTGHNRKVVIHRAEHLEAPKDHTDVVNRLENTAFKFNSGNDVFIEMFSDDSGNLDVDRLVEHLLGTEESATNKDGRDRYNAKKAALVRDIESYTKAKEDVQDGELFFDWFIARNQRIHLDSNRLNPQNDKNIARWLVTTANSIKEISKDDIEKAANGDSSASIDARMFLYSIVQAFDGIENVPGIDKDPEGAILNSAKNILENTSDSDLMKMAMDPKIGHLGHAALAVANIRKYRDSKNSIKSDMVLEVDGLTNGFAFRAMQFPVDTEGSPLTSKDWLAKVGVIFKEETNKLSNIDSMNAVGSLGESDVYVSVGNTFSDRIAEKKNNLSKSSSKWVSLMEKHGKLPDFSDTNDKDVRKFIRNLMKSPVMIFNYAASVGRIATGLVNDQINGTNYLSGRGLIDILTERGSDKKYVISKEELQKTFGSDLGEVYNDARKAMDTKSINDLGVDSINVLRRDLTDAITDLYKDPVSTTLKELFGKQTSINQVLVQAAQFMFDHFQEQYNLWRDTNPNATEDNKLEFLKNMASIIPGIGGASSDDQSNKLMFLKNAFESTDNEARVITPSGKFSANTVSKSFGEPGVGPAVLSVLSLDSTVMARSLNDSFKGKKHGGRSGGKYSSGALPVHDAIVLGIGEANTIESYNSNFYTTNRGYSISQEFVNAIEAFEKTVPGAVDRTIVSNDGFNIKFNTMKSELIKVNKDIQDARKDIFSKDVKVGQLVGLNGTMADIDVQRDKEAASKFLAKSATHLLEGFSEGSVKKALGKDYSKYKKQLDDMLKGCL